MFFALLQQSSALLIGFIFIIGLLVGSFLNVVIYRLPLMMQAEWRRECHAYLDIPFTEEKPPFNLLLPASHCPMCKTAIKAYQNIPVISYLLLSGKCGHCRRPIPARYPLVEALTGLGSALVAWHFGYCLALPFALLLTWCLITLSFIDMDHQLLPDEITQPLTWLGLLLSLMLVFNDASSCVIGAVAGYLSLWSVYQLHKLLTGKEGMGHGDFKLLAMLGAWLGWQYLPAIIFISAVTGSIAGISLMVLADHKSQQSMPFGQWLALAGWLVMLWGDRINDMYLQAANLAG